MNSAWITTVATLFLAVIASGADSAEIASLKAELAGVWLHQHRQLGVSAETIKTYHADGRYVGQSKVSMLGTTSGVNYEGRWTILPDRTLRIEVTKTDNRLYVPMGEVYLMKNLEIKDGVMTYEHKGKPDKETRRP